MSLGHRTSKWLWKRAFFESRFLGWPFTVPRSTTALANTDQKTQPSLQPLQVLRSVDLICHLWQQYVTDAIFPLASTSVTVRRDMAVFNNQTVSRIEGAANAFLQRMIDCEFKFPVYVPSDL